jgi:hypothetical protein
LIRELNAGNERFAAMWATGEMAAAHREDRKTIDHPLVGPVTVDCDTLTAGDNELKIVIWTAVPGSEDGGDASNEPVQSRGSRRREPNQIRW